MPYALGVDLGTTYLAAAVYEGRSARAVRLAGEEPTARAAIYVTPEGKVAVGPKALGLGQHDPIGLVLNAKRRLGGDLGKVVRQQTYTAEQMMGVMLRWVLQKVADQRGGPPARVTLTHPANWLDHRLERLSHVAYAAGLTTDVGFQPEPEAAAIFYTLRAELAVGSLVAVYDLGGGTFDASIIQKTPEGFQLVGEPAGIDNLGGIDFDLQLRGFVHERITRLTDRLDERDLGTAVALAELDRRIEQAKVDLSGATATAVVVDLPSGVTEVRVTRDELNALIAPDLERTVDELERAVDQAGIGPRDLAAVLLVGGASQIPLVSELLAARVGSQLVIDRDHPKLAVSLGAAITAGSMARLSAARSVAPARPAAAPPEAPARSPGERGVPSPQLPGAHGTLHLGSSDPTRISVELAAEGLAGQTDNPLVGVPLTPAVDPFPRERWISDDPTGDDPAGFETSASAGGLQPILLLLVVAALVAAVVVAVAVLG